MRTQERPGEPSRAQETTGEQRTPQESPGDHRRAQEQESPEPRCVCVLVVEEAIKAQWHLTTTKAMQQRLNFKIV